MGSSGSPSPAYLTCSDGSAFHHHHILGGLGAWGGGPKFHANFGREKQDYMQGAVTAEPIGRLDAQDKTSMSIFKDFAAKSRLATSDDEALQ